MGRTPDIITVTLNAAIDRILEVDGLVVGSHQTVRELLRVPAGKGLNVSRALAALGVPSTATGFLGRENRAIFETVLDGHNIVDAFVTLPGRSRENITLTDRRTNQDTHFRDAGLPVNGGAIDRLSDELRRLMSPGSLVVFSGSLPPGMGTAELAALAAVCRSAGARVAVDMAGDALKVLAREGLWLAKPNVGELAQFAGREFPDERQRVLAARMLAETTEQVIVTCGAVGALLLTRELAIHAAVPTAGRQIASTVGCGDILLAGYLAGLWHGLDAREAFARAVACASAKAMSYDPAGFDPALAESLRRQVHLRDVVI